MMEYIFMLYGAAGAFSCLPLLADGKHEEIPAIIWAFVGARLLDSPVPIFFAIPPFLIFGCYVLRLLHKVISSQNKMPTQPKEGPKNTEV
jgi:hypothetical protein